MSNVTAGNLRRLCRKIVAVGRNFAEHAQELGNTVVEQPVIFLKPSTSLIEQGESIRLPPGAVELHHEVELGLIVGKRLSNIPASAVPECIAGFIVALDMTDRNLQNSLKSQRLPWTLAKGFDTACPIGPLLPVSMLPQNLLAPTPPLADCRHSLSETVELWLSVNGMERQRSTTDKMLHRPSTLVSYISRWMLLEPGDIILTGTPGGVGLVRSGDVITAGIKGLCEVKFDVT